jgi:regulator of telomere elongation helicase 1
MPERGEAVGVECGSEHYEVDFPFKPYSCQRVFMQKAMEAMHGRQNALLESPTGTGKTACLLCSSLAFQQLHPSSPSPTVVFASRTHAQLSQAVSELKKTSYRPRMTLLSSRQQSCILPSAYRDARNVDAACRSLVARRKCPHYRQLDSFLRHDTSFDSGQPHDIEDLVHLATHTSSSSTSRAGPGPCPYYLAREHAKRAQLVFLPYSYIVDPRLRRSIGDVDFSNAIVIFDEAHNLEQAASEAASCDLSIELLAQAAREVQACIEAMAAHETSGEIAVGDDPRARRDKEDFRTLKGTLNALWHEINGIELQHQSHSTNRSTTRDGSFIFELLERVGLTEGEELNYTEMLEDAEALFVSEHDADQQRNDAGDVSIRSTSHSAAGKSSGGQRAISQLKGQLRAIFDAKREGVVYAYKVHVAEDSANSESRKVGFWCFVPGVHLNRFVQTSGVRSILLASGTLSPMDSFASELMLKFPVRLENTHVISAQQIWAGVLTAGPGNQRLDSSYNARGTDEYKLELGRTLYNLSKTIPQGLLVFFPSYTVLESCTQRWKELPMSPSGYKSVWERIEENKPIVLEPKDSTQFSASQQDYRNRIERQNSTGAIFFAVCRGKASEGLDFSDNAGRAAVVTGIPFAMKTDPKVMIKRQFMNERSKSLGCINGDEWYVQTAMRAVNQALGRIIRHRHDFGAVILADRRFAGQREHNQLSRWLRGYVRNCETFGSALRELSGFFSSNGHTITISRMKQEAGRRRHNQENISNAERQGREEQEAGRKAGMNVSRMLENGECGNETKLSGNEHQATKAPLAERLQGIKRQAAEEGPSQQHEHERPAKASKYGSSSVAAAVDVNDAIERCLGARGQCPEMKVNSQHRQHAEPSAQEFMAYVKDVLSKQQCSDFQSVLKGFKKGTVSFQVVLEVAAALFGEQSTLLRAFGAFVPASERSLFEERMSTSQSQGEQHLHSEKQASNETAQR